MDPRIRTLALAGIPPSERGQNVETAVAKVKGYFYPPNWRHSQMAKPKASMPPMKAVSL